MTDLNMDEQRRLQEELSSGERLLWAGKPNPRVWWHPSDWYQTVFAIFFAGFSIFWEAGVSGFIWNSKQQGPPSIFMMIWGVPFILMGQYMLWVRFFYVAWKKRKVVYAVTNERVLVLVSPPRQKIISSFLRSIPGINKESRPDGNGTLKFGEVPSIWGSRGSKKPGELYLNLDVPVFQDIDDVNAVEGEVRRAMQMALANPNPN